MSVPRQLLALLGLLMASLITGCITGGGSGSSESSDATGGDGEITLYWAPPEARVNGSAFMPSQVDRYELSFGTQSGDYTERVVTRESSTTLGKLRSGVEYHIVIRVYDDAGRASDYSDEVTVEAK